MNTLVKCTVATVTLALAVGMIACEKESMLQPINGPINTPGPEYPEPGPNTPIPTTGNRLVTYGHWQLSYDAKGNLAQLQSTMYPNLRREYNVGAANGTGVIITDYEGAKLQRKTLILLDSKGRCAESWNNHYGVDDGKPTSAVTHYKYYYNGSGQLDQISNVDVPGQYHKLVNNENGVVSISEYKGWGQIASHTFSYSKNGLSVADKNYLNIVAGPLSDQVDEFLPIYGKANGYLPLEYTLYNTATASKVLLDRIAYQYYVNAKGRIVKRINTRYTANQVLTDTYLFEYK